MGPMGGSQLGGTCGAREGCEERRHHRRPNRGEQGLSTGPAKREQVMMSYAPGSFPHQRSCPRMEFVPVHQVRAHEYVAEQIRRQIALRLVRPGDALPSERELVTVFGVARRTVQQALRVLDREGLVVARRGRFGGTFVLESRDDTQSVDELASRVRRRREEVLELLDYRRLIEPGLTRVAADLASPTDLAAIDAALRGMTIARNEPEYMRFDTAFHVAVAEATHNRHLVKAVEDTRMGLNDALSLLPRTGTWRRCLSAQHDSIFAGIQARHPDAAAAAAEAHVMNSDKGVRALLIALTVSNDINGRRNA